MKRILHVSKFFYPQEGGIEIVCRNIIESQPDFQHLVICFNSQNKTTCEVVQKIDVKRVSTFFKLASQPLSFTYLFEFQKTIREYKPDLIHFHAPNPLIMLFTILLKPKKTKLIIHWHSDIVEQKFLYFFVKPIETAFLKLADRIFITSQKYQEGSKPLQKFKEKTLLVPCAIEPSNFNLQNHEIPEFESFKKKFSNKKIVFSIGRLVTYKGIEFLIESEKFIQSDCKILIAGAGSLSKSLQKMVTSDRIQFLGKLSSKDLKYYFHLADVFAFPSITKNEAFGVVLAEAMYCETPAVTFTIKGSGVNWVSLNNVTGIEVENRNSKLFGQAIDRLLADDELRKSLALNAKRRVLENFTMDIIGPIVKAEYNHQLL